MPAGTRHSTGTGRGKGKKKLAAILTLALLPVFANAGSTALAEDSGGFADGGNYYGNSASGSYIAVDTGTYTNVYGGYSDSENATNNIVNIAGGSTTNVYGGYVTSGDRDAFTGNKLVVSSTHAITGSANNFATIEFGTGGTYTFDVSLDNPGAEGTYATTFVTELTNEVELNGGITDGSSATLGVTKIGSGTLVLSGDNTYSGPTVIEQGLLKLANASAISNSSLTEGDYVIYKGAALVLGDLGWHSTQHFRKSISGEGDLIIDTGAYVVLDANVRDDFQNSNTYTGSTIVRSDATLEIVESVAFSNGDYILDAPSATLKLNVADSQDLPVGYFTNDVSGAGTLEVEITDATMVLAGDLSDHTGVTTVSIPEGYTHATLRLASQQSVSGGSYELDSGSTFELAFEGSFGQAISGGENTALSIDSPGEVVLTKAQSEFSGDTVVKSGTLRLENAMAAGTSTNAISMADGTTLTLAYSGEFSRGITITGTTGEVNLVIDAAAESSTSAVQAVAMLANVMTYATDDSNTLTLTGSVDDITGMVTILSGNVIAASNDLAGTSGLTMYGGASFTPTGNYSLSGKVLNLMSSETGAPATIYGKIDAVGATINYAWLHEYEGPLLVVDGDADISNSVNNLTWADGITPGEDIQLLSVTGKIDYEGATVSSYSRGLLVYQGYLSFLEDENGTIMVVRYAEPTTRGESKALLEGSLAAATLVTQGADMVAGRGIEAARTATKNAQARAVTPFAAVQGGNMRYNSGSHIDTKSLNLMAGLAVGGNAAIGEFTFGAFFEYGTGSYSTYNSFSSGSYDGDGNSRYVGWGLLGRWDFLDTGPGHFYVEASGRMGGLYNSYENDDLSAGFGTRSDYDRYNAYYGFHAGLGYIFDFAEKAHLDVYGKYFWTRVDGESVTLSGQTVDFEDFISSRLRLGTRFTWDVNEQVKPYIGAAWEHEFDGKSRGSISIDGYGADITSPSLRGDTGIGEIGISLTPSENVPFTLDIAVQGYVGKREGVTGSVLFKYAF